MNNPFIVLLVVVLATLGVLPGLANAETKSPAVLDFDSLSADNAFKDLPGVKPPQEQEARRDFQCTTRFADEDDVFPGPHRLRPKRVYSCTDGIVTLEGGTPPRSLEREKRGLNW